MSQERLKRVVAFYIIHYETAMEMHIVRQMSSHNHLTIVKNHLKIIKHLLKASQRVLKRLKSALERLKSVLDAP